MATSTGTEPKLASTLERVIFGYRRTILITFALVTVVMLFVAVRGLRIDASFTKQLPLKHEYMQTFMRHQSEFGSANRVLIALIARDGKLQGLRDHLMTGNKPWDNAAIAAVKAAAPFAPLPKTYAYPTLEVHFHFEAAAK